MDKHCNLNISNFRFAILKYCPTALLGRAAFAVFERFAAGKTSAQTKLISAEHFKPKGGSRLWRLEPKKKDMIKDHVFLFGAGEGNRTLVFSLGS